MKIKNKLYLVYTWFQGFYALKLCLQNQTQQSKTEKKRLKKKKKKQITTIERESERSHLYQQWVCWLTVATSSVISSSFTKAVFGWGENREDGKQREENRVENTVFHCLVGEGKWGRQKTREKVFSLGPTFFILPNQEEKPERKVLSQHFYTNIPFLSPLITTNTTATNTTIFLSNISKLKHNQIIRIQTQKHNFKINQIITIKAKKKKKKKEKKRRRQKIEERSHLTHLDCVGDEDERWLQAGPIALGRR